MSVGSRTGTHVTTRSRPRLVNMYGITETCVHVSHRPIDTAVITGGASVIGGPIPGLRIHLLDNCLRPVPAGVVGEIYIAGGQLARGYVGRPGLTATRFVANPFDAPGERLYRSGDTAMWTETGELVYVGRSDHQVKVRGYRIELGEVESALAALPGVANAAAAVRQDVNRAPAAGRIRGPRSAAPANRSMSQASRDATRRAAARLHGARQRCVVLDALPLTVNGKLDRAALPAPAESSRPTAIARRRAGAAPGGADAAGRPVHRDPRYRGRARRRLLHHGRRQHRRHPAGEPGPPPGRPDHSAAGLRQPHAGGARRSGRATAWRRAAGPRTTPGPISARSC